MAADSDAAVKQLSALMDEEFASEPALKETFQNMHQGYPEETLLRFLRAREFHVPKAHKMLADCLRWRIHDDIDNILAKPILPVEVYKKIRESQLSGMSGYSKLGLPVFAIGVGRSTYEKDSISYYVHSHIQMNEYRDRVLLPMASKKHGRHISIGLKVLDMSGLKLSALNQLRILTGIFTIDDLNYPEKTETYYIVNAPYIFSACWKVVKPLLQERTRKKIQVLHGSGREGLLKIMDYASLPHFCRGKDGSSSSRTLPAGEDCFSFDHPFHQELYNYIQQQASAQASVAPLNRNTFVDLLEQDHEDEIIQTIEAEFQKLEIQNGTTKID